MVHAIGGSRSKGSLEWLWNVVLKFVKLNMTIMTIRIGRTSKPVKPSLGMNIHLPDSASDFEVAHGKMDMIHSHMVRS